MNGSLPLSRGPRARRRTALIAVVVAAGLTLAACGGGGDDDMAGMDHGGDKKSSAASADTGPAPGAFNDADVMFAQMMIPHHEQALEMSALAAGRVEDAEVKALATEISGAQDPEIRTMRSWLKSWGRPESAGGGHGGHGSGGGEMAGMMSTEDMDRLKAAKGAKFDRAFAELMIGHHEGAVEMAREQRKDGRNATAKKLAEEVITAQSAEIDRLKKILDRL
ncbi:DUF305 domain-containing protein [Streptomyces sp. NPDC000594]|uniref:DUF305 domain-containing protein n=1 Tax=Streptomyces sp. NPDC000594 TaxID=3154261 RepID=UPI0033332B12